MANLSDSKLTKDDIDIVKNIQKVNKPDILSPNDGEKDLQRNFEIIGSAFSINSTIYERDYREFQVRKSGDDWDSLVVDEKEDSDSLEVSLDLNEDYEVRIRDVLANGDSSEWSNVVSFSTSEINDPLKDDDGQPEIQYGDTELGFYGEVSTDDLIRGDDLASDIGLSAGTAFNDTEPWLKFAYRGTVIYIAKKPYRYGLSFESIYEAGAAYGSGDTGNEPFADWESLGWEGSPTETTQDAEVEINNTSFVVRLLQGTDGEFSISQDDNDPHNEWNRLIYAVHEETDSEDWGVNYTDGDLGLGSGDGRATLVQESPEENSVHRVTRGNYGVSDSPSTDSGASTSSRGWRPALVPSDS